MLIGFVDALPVFGTGTVFLPWILLILLQENWTFALWLFLLYGVTWLTREILEPRLLGDGIGMLPICFLISVILGLQCFGASGLVTGPFGVLFVKELWAELQNPAPPETPSASSSADEYKKCDRSKDKAVPPSFPELPPLHTWYLPQWVFPRGLTVPGSDDVVQ